jgi:hypothetical protein
MLCDTMPARIAQHQARMADYGLCLPAALIAVDMTALLQLGARTRRRTQQKAQFSRRKVALLKAFVLLLR